MLDLTSWVEDEYPVMYAQYLREHVLLLICEQY